MFFKQKKQTNSATNWFDELDTESQQDTCIKYLRSLDKTSLKRLYEAVDLYRKGDVALGRVKEPEVVGENNNDNADTGDFLTEE